MSMLPTPNFVTTEEITIYLHNGKTSKNLAPGSFVRPIEPIYLPDHIKETLSYRWLNPETEVFCYTHYGIAVVDKSKMRKA